MKLLLPLLIMAPMTLLGQNCYDTFRKEGLDLARRKEYAEAINRYWAALICPGERPANNDLSDLIKDAQNRWVRDLENAVQRERKAYQEALEAKIAAEKARTAEEAARREAETNAQKAKEQGQRAETLRIALLADIVRQKGSKTDALLLSYLAMRLSGADIAPFVNRAFGEAVRDSFTQTFFSNASAVQHLTPFNGGRHLLARTADRALYVLQPDQGITVLLPETDAAGAAVADKTDRLLTWGADGRATLWSSAGAPVARLEGHTEAIRYAAFSPDGRMVATGARDNTARIWDAQGKLLATLTGHTGNVLVVQFSADSRHVLTRAADGKAKIWTTDGQLKGTVGSDNAFIYDGQILPDGETVVALLSDGAVGVWRINGQAIGNAALPQGASAKQVLAAEESGMFWVLAGDRFARKFDKNGQLVASLEHPVPVSGLSVSAEGLVTRADDHVIRVWDRAGKPVRVLRGHRDAIVQTALSANGEYVLSTSKDATARLWDAQGNIVSEWQLGAHLVPARFAADGQSPLLVLNDGKAVARTPLPAERYRQLGTDRLLESPFMQDVIGRYNIQLFEALVPKN
jgi:hypothetical protein